MLRQVGASPNRPAKIRRALSSSCPPVKPEEMSGPVALAACVMSDVGVRGYRVFRRVTGGMDNHPRTLPAYEKVTEAKRECYPDSDSMTFTKTSAEVKSQALLDHETERLVATLPPLSEPSAPVNQHCSVPAPVPAVLHVKWGFDGATGQSVYKQAGGGDEAVEQSLLCTTIVPLQLTVRDAVVTSPAPSSTRLCRPLRIQASVIHPRQHVASGPAWTRRSVA